MSNVVIAIGGTGARCAESVAHLAATGSFPRHLRVLLVDLDQKNGNLQRTHQVLSRYHALSQWVDGESMFATGIEHDVWQAESVAGTASRTFGALLGRATASADVGQFLDTFFPASYYDIDLSGGCFQKPEIGAIALRLMLRQSLEDPTNALYRALQAIAEDLSAGQEVRVFVVGSVFGGTGASGLPFLPRLLRDELPVLFPEVDIQAENLILGAAMIAPYFQWSGGGDGDPNAPDRNRLSPHAKAVLLHYAKHPPDYRDLYVIGAPELYASGKYAPNGQRQLHEAHYIELTGALAALDFFRRGATDGRSFHYVESTRGGETEERRQLGINWQTMPFGALANGAIREGLLRQALTARFSSDYLLPRLRGDRFFRYPWFEDAVRAPLPDEEDSLISETFDDQLRWLREIMASITAIGDGRDHPSLFPVHADELTVFDPPIRNSDGADVEVTHRVRRLLRGEMPGNDFDALCSRLDDGVDHADLPANVADRTVLGRLLYVTERAVAQHLEDEAETIALLKPAAPAEHGEAQSRYLPRLRWEPGVKTEIGTFTRGGPELLQALAEGLDVGDADTGVSNPISSPWARAFLFETSLANDEVERQRAVATWRGLLGIVAFRLELGRGRSVTDAGIRLERDVRGPADDRALGEFAREARGFGRGAWSDFRLLLVAGRPIAGTSPLTLLFPSSRLRDALTEARAVPWFDRTTGELGDPAPHLERQGETYLYLPLLKAWIDDLITRLSATHGAVLAGSYAHDLIQRELRAWRDSKPFAAVERARPEFENPSLLGRFQLPAIPVQQRTP